MRLFSIFYSSKNPKNKYLSRFPQQYEAEMFLDFWRIMWHKDWSNDVEKSVYITRITVNLINTICIVFLIK